MYFEKTYVLYGLSREKNKREMRIFITKKQRKDMWGKSIQ